MSRGAIVWPSGAIRGGGAVSPRVSINRLCPISTSSGRPRIEAQLWASPPGSRPIHRWILRNSQAMEVAISDLGASLFMRSAPDARGVFDNVLRSVLPNQSF